VQPERWVTLHSTGIGNTCSSRSKQKLLSSVKTRDSAEPERTEVDSPCSSVKARPSGDTLCSRRMYSSMSRSLSVTDDSFQGTGTSLPVQLGPAFCHPCLWNDLLPGHDLRCRNRHASISVGPTSREHSTLVSGISPQSSLPDTQRADVYEQHINVDHELQTNLHRLAESQYYALPNRRDSTCCPRS
jgi:hypothetical protein